MAASGPRIPSAGMQQMYRKAHAPAAPHIRDGIARLSGGLNMVPPGLCDVASRPAYPRLARPARPLFPRSIGRKS
jgi:hypothetical protein